MTWPTASWLIGWKACPLIELSLLSWPSIKKLFARGRAPFTEKPTPFVKSSREEGWATPGSVNASEIGFKLRKGRLLISGLLMLALSSPDCVWSSWPMEASTMTVVACALTSSVPLTVAVSDAFTSTLEILSTANPGAVTSATYRPGISASMRYVPWESVFVLRFSPPRSVLDAVTIAFGTPAPLLSKIVPAMVPLLVCAKLAPAARNTVATNT